MLSIRHKKLNYSNLKKSAICSIKNEKSPLLRITTKLGVCSSNILLALILKVFLKIPLQCMLFTCFRNMGKGLFFKYSEYKSFVHKYFLACLFTLMCFDEQKVLILTWSNYQFFKWMMLFLWYYLTVWY